MCDTAGGVLVAIPRREPGQGLARVALGGVAERYGARLARSLDEDLAIPMETLAGFEPPATAPVLPDCAVELVDVPRGSEQEFADDVRREYLDVVIGHPRDVVALGDPADRLYVAPNTRLHPAAGATDTVPDPFTFDPCHDGHLTTLGLDNPTTNPQVPVTVAVLDNGFDAQMWTGIPTPQPIASAVDLVPSDAGTSGHGTLVAAIVKDAAPAAKVVPIRMAGDKSSEYDALHGLARAVQVDAVVMTLSYRQLLGSDVTCKKCGMVRQAARMEVMERMIEWAATAGGRERAVLAAAGNDGAGDVARPARSPRAVPVTALDETCSSLASFANWDSTGKQSVLALPGEKVALKTGTQDYYQGTSFATAYAAALCAESMMRTGASATKVTDDLIRQAASTVSNAAVVAL